MNGFNIASIIGAAAWIYPITVFIYGKFVRPRIRIIPAEAAELGYTAFGPIFNIQCAICSDKKDALIEHIHLEITLDDGDKHILNWKFLDEAQSAIRPYSGEEGGILAKSETAIALKVSTSLVSQKKIGFQDDIFLKKSREHNQRVFSQLRHLSKVIDSDYDKELRRTKEYTDVTNFVRNGMYWKIGEYTLRFFVGIVTLREPYQATFKFHLDENDIQILKNNAEQFDLLRDVLSAGIPSKSVDQIPLTWGWVYPKIEKP